MYHVRVEWFFSKESALHFLSDYRTFSIQYARIRKQMVSKQTPNRVPVYFMVNGLLQDRFELHVYGRMMSPEIVNCALPKWVDQMIGSSIMGIVSGFCGGWILSSILYLFVISCNLGPLLSLVQNCAMELVQKINNLFALMYVNKNNLDGCLQW